MSRRYQSKPSFSQVSSWKREGKVWVDEDKRSYGKRTDPAFDEEYHGDEEAWWVNLPRLPQGHLRADEIVDFPRAGTRLTLKQGDDAEIEIEIVEYPEVIKRGQKTAAVNIHKI